MKRDTQSAEAILPDGYVAERTISQNENRLVVKAGVPGGRSTVFKFLLPPFDEQDAEDFCAEYLLLDALSHPYWVRPKRFGERRGIGLFIEMDEAPGIPLSVHPLRGWRPETLEASRRILSGLSSLHRLGVAHLDLKPEQILLDLDHQVSDWNTERAFTCDSSLDLRILDLGLAAEFRTPLKARGTPGFMAPELLRGEPDWDARADIYALGAVLFDLFTGRPAFEAGDAASILALQLSGDIPDPGAIRELPPQVRTLLREMLSPDPRERPSAALEVWQRLREQVPRDRVRDLPARLTGPDTFAFLDREEEIGLFERFVREHPDSGRNLVVRVTGEKGTGRARLAARLCAVAQTMGWTAVESEERLHHLQPHGAQGTLTIDASGRTDQTEEECLTLQLHPMGDEWCDAMLQTRGIESSLLRNRVVGFAGGNPGLLYAAIATLPAELEVIVPLVGADLIDTHLAESPPPYWIEWHRDLLDRLDPEEGDALVRGALLNSEQTKGVCQAILKANPERTRVLGRDLLGSALADAPPFARAELAANLGFTEILDEVLGAAIEELLCSQRHEDALRLFSKAHAVMDASSKGFAQESLLKLADSAMILGIRHGSLLPAPDNLCKLAGNPGVPAAILLMAWSALARNQWETAEACLVRPEAAECAPFLCGWLRFRRYRLSRDLPAALDALNAVASTQADDPSKRFLAESGRAEVLRHQGKLDEAAAALRPLLDQPFDVPEALRFTAVQMAANLAINQGDLDRAHLLLQEALELVDRHLLRVSRPMVLLGLSGLEYQLGNLPKSLEWCEGLLKEWTREQRWDQAVTALSNVGLLLLEQGRIGEAIDALSWGRFLASEAGTHLSRIRIERRTAQALAWTGAHDRAEDRAHRLLEDSRVSQPERGHIMCILGQALMDAGRFLEGREAFAGGVQCLGESGAREDEVDAMGFWALSELDAGCVDAARSLRLKSEDLMSGVSGITMSIRLLVDGRLSVQAGEAPEKSLAILDQTVALLREQNRWFFAWQAHWFRARALVWLEDAAAAAGEYAEARRILSTMVKTIREESRASWFLRKPAPRQFLEETEMA